MVSVGNAAFLIWFLLYITANDIPVDAVNVTIFLGFLTVLNWVTIWDTYEHFITLPIFFPEAKDIRKGHRNPGRDTRILISLLLLDGPLGKERTPRDRSRNR